MRSRREGTTHLYHMILEELDPPPSASGSSPASRPTPGRPSSRTTSASPASSATSSRNARPSSPAPRASGTSSAPSCTANPSPSPPPYPCSPRHFTIADLGCGTAPVAAQLAPHVAKVIAVDNSPAMLKAARKRTVRTSRTSTSAAATSNALPIDDRHAATPRSSILSLTYVPDPPPSSTNCPASSNPAAEPSSSTCSPTTATTSAARWASSTSASPPTTSTDAAPAWA